MKKSFFFLLLILALAAAGASALADAGDTPETAITVEPGVSVTGSLVSDRDHDYYVFTLPAEGSVYIGFKHEYIDSKDNYWKLDILDGNLNTYFTTLWNGDSFMELYTRTIGLDAGTYYIHIWPRDYRYSGVSYTMTVYYTASDEWEKEWNNTPVNATEISVNKKYNGAIQTSDDVDQYMFSVPSDGYVTIGFDHKYIDSGSDHWNLVIHDAYKNVFLSRRFLGATMVETLTCPVGLPAGTYFVKIWAVDYRWESMPYTFELYYEPSETFETEFNNVPPDADPIMPGIRYSGSVVDEDDKDYYRFALNEQAHVTFSFHHEYVDSGSTYWNVRFLDLNMNEMAKYSFRGNGAQDYTSDPITLEAGTYFVYVDDESYHHSSTVYSLMVSVQ